MGERTPLALLTAERENAPATGMERAKLLIMLHKPSAIISWEASTLAPLAATCTLFDLSTVSEQCCQGYFRLNSNKCSDDY